MKARTLQQVEAMKSKAVRFVSDVLQDDDRAADIEAESPEDYAARKRIQIITNPRRKEAPMPRASRSTQQSRAELQERIDELEAQNEELQDKLDSIADVVNDEDDEEPDSDEEEE